MVYGVEQGDVNRMKMTVKEKQEARRFQEKLAAAVIVKTLNGEREKDWLYYKAIERLNKKF